MTDEVMRDIDYIKNYKSVAPKAKPATDYKEGKIVKAVIASVYPQTFGFIAKNFSKEEAIEKLRWMGQRSVAIFYSIHPQRLQKKGSFVDIVKDIGVHSGERVKVEKQITKNGVLQNCIIRKYKCIFCTDTYPVETPIFFCYPSASFYQHYYNIRSLLLGTLKPKLVFVDIIKTAENDDDYCLYSVERVA
jgi:hypothetical protein